MPEQVTRRNLFRVLAAGFSGVIVLLLAAGFIGLNNARIIQQSASALEETQRVNNRLIEELQREQATLNAAFYRLSRGPDEMDRDRLLAQLNDSDAAVDKLASDAAGSAEAPLWNQLAGAARQFSAEARRVLAQANPSSYLSRDLFRRHEQVTRVVGSLVAASWTRALAAQSRIDRRSTAAAKEAAILLGVCLVLAVICAGLTVKVTAGLLRRMELQASELSRVSWKMLETQETTARRFSHELHDELGQNLTAIKANLLAIDRAGKLDRMRLEDCAQLVDEAIRNVRELSQLLRPTILDDFGLDAGLRWLSERFTERTGIEVVYHSTLEQRLAEQTETHLFRIVQEALTNVARHSGASRVEINLEGEGNRVRLRLRDNGRGIQNHGAGTAEGMGLIGMRARARSAGGELMVESRAAGGVSIDLWVPGTKHDG